MPQGFKTRLVNSSDLGIVNLSQLKVNDTLQYEEWKTLDEAVVQPAREPLNVTMDLMSNNMVFDLGEDGYLSSMQLDWQNSTEVEDAHLVMDAQTQTERDRVEFNTFSVPLPLVMREFAIGDRQLRMSRKLGQPLDVHNAREASRKVSEKLEDLVVNGDANFSFKGNGIEGLTNATNRLTDSFGTNGSWDQSAKTGQNILDDVLSMIQTAESSSFFGPYMVYAPRDASSKLSEDFKSESDKTTIQRLREIDGIMDVKVADKLASGNVALVQMTAGNSVEIVNGFEPQLVSWQGNRGPFVTDWAILAGMSVRVHTDGGSGSSPIVHMS